MVKSLADTIEELNAAQHGGREGHAYGLHPSFLKTAVRAYSEAHGPGHLFPMILQIYLHSENDPFSIPDEFGSKLDNVGPLTPQFQELVLKKCGFTRGKLQKKLALTYPGAVVHKIKHGGAEDRPLIWKN